MHTAVKPRLTAGIAALGASAIIATTVSAVPHTSALPALPALPGVSASVELVSLVNPFAAIGEVVQYGINNVEQLGAHLAQQAQQGRLFPIAKAGIDWAIADIQALPTYIGTALNAVVSNFQTWGPVAIDNFKTNVQAGNWEEGLGALLMPLIFTGIDPALTNSVAGIVNLVAQPFQAVANVINTIPSSLQIVLATTLIQPLANALQSTGYTIDTVGAALKTGDLGNVYNAVVDSMVFGAEKFIDVFVNTGGYGLIDSLLSIRSTIATAIRQAFATPAPAGAMSAVSTDSMSSDPAALPAAAAASLTLAPAGAVATRQAKRDRQAQRDRHATATAATDSTAADTKAAASKSDDDTATSVRSTRDHRKKDTAAGTSSTDSTSSTTKGDKGTHTTGTHKPGKNNHHRGGHRGGHHGK